MAGSTGELQTEVTADVSELISGFQKAREELALTATSATDFATAWESIDLSPTVATLTTSIDELTAAIEKSSAAFAGHSTAAEELAASYSKQSGELSKSTEATTNATASTADLTSGSGNLRDKIHQTVTVLHDYQAGWKGLAVTVVQSGATVVAAVIGFKSAQEKAAAASLSLAAAEQFKQGMALRSSVAMGTDAAATLAMGTANAVATPPTFTLAAAVNFLLSPIVLATAAIALLAGGVWYFSQSAEQTTEKVEASSDAIEDHGKRSKKTLADVMSLEAAERELQKTLGKAGAAKPRDDKTPDAKEIRRHSLGGEDDLTSIGLAKKAFKGELFDDDEIRKAKELAAAGNSLINSWGNLKATIEQPFIDAISAVSAYVGGWVGFGDVVDSVTEQVSVAVKAMDSFTASTKSAIEEAQKWLYKKGTGASSDEADEWMKRGNADRDKQIQQDKSIAKQKEHGALMSRFGDAQVKADEDATRSAEKLRISRLGTVEAVEKEIRALQARTQADVASGKIGKAGVDRNAKDIADMVAQKQGIIDGTFQPPKDAGEQVVESLKKQYEALAFGARQSQLNEALAKATDDAQRERIRNQFVANNNLADAQKAAKDQQAALSKEMDAGAAIEGKAALQIVDLKDKIDVLAGAATEAEIAMRKMHREHLPPARIEEIAALQKQFDELSKGKKGDETITHLKDQIDLLTGAATAADIAMRELTRQGFSQDQIAEIGQLTAQIDALKGQNKGKEDRAGNAPVALKGSREAAEIMLRGIGGGSRLERLGEQQLAEQKDINKGIRLPRQDAGKPMPAPPAPEPPEGNVQAGARVGPKALAIVPLPLLPVPIKPVAVAENVGVPAPPAPVVPPLISPERVSTKRETVQETITRLARTHEENVAARKELSPVIPEKVQSPERVIPKKESVQETIVRLSAVHDENVAARDGVKKAAEPVASVPSVKGMWMPSIPQPIMPRNPVSELPDIDVAVGKAETPKQLLATAASAKRNPKATPRVVSHKAPPTIKFAPHDRRFQNRPQPIATTKPKPILTTSRPPGVAVGKIATPVVPPIVLPIAKSVPIQPDAGISKRATDPLQSVKFDLKPLERYGHQTVMGLADVVTAIRESKPQEFGVGIV